MSEIIYFEDKHAIDEILTAGLKSKGYFHIVVSSTESGINMWSNDTDPAKADTIAIMERSRETNCFMIASKEHDDFEGILARAREVAEEDAIALDELDMGEIDDNDREIINVYHGWMSVLYFIKSMGVSVDL